jgi:acetylornithine deacetylase/succinyl-diaminopimelate desuccinylase-like protein
MGTNKPLEIILIETITSPKQYAKEHHQRFLQELFSFTRIPSISTDPSRAGDVHLAAEWVAAKLIDLGADKVSISSTGGHPIVYGELIEAGEEAPIVLVYGHYDVQPADPLDEWESDPFDPVIRGENIYSRGISDMKGQICATLLAIESILKTDRLPVNFKFLIEGEEEVGSPNLPAFVEQNREMLKSSFVLNPDTGMINPDLPTITYALRGLAFFEIHIWGPDHDLHSGIFGGAVHNPAQALAELIASMHDESGKITLPGFYANVQPLNTEERLELSRLPKDEAWYLQNSGALALWGEPGYTPDERVSARPSLDVNGIYSGFIGEGEKTVLPSHAMAKLSCRLVPDQDPEEVHQQLIAFCKENVPQTVRWEVIKKSGGKPTSSNRHSPWIRAYVQAAEDVWGVKPAFKREGGSVPIISTLQDQIGVDSVNIGFGLPTDNMHGPNEKLHIPTWTKGIKALIHFFYNLGRL